MESDEPGPPDMTFAISVAAKRQSAVMCCLAGLVLFGLATFGVGSALLQLLEAAASVRGVDLIVTWTAATLFVGLWAAIVGLIVRSARRWRWKFKEFSGFVEINERWIDLGKYRIFVESMRSVELREGFLLIGYLCGGKNRQVGIPLAWLPPGAGEQVKLEIEGIMRGHEGQRT